MEDKGFEITETPSTKDVDFLTKKINEEVIERGAAHPFAI